MNLIIKNLLTEFRKNFEVDSATTPQKAFELYANHLVSLLYTPAKVDPFELTTQEDDAGIDGIQIFVEGEPVTNADELEAILTRPKREFEAEIIFVQAKSSEKIAKKDIGNFSDGVYDFFSDISKLPHGDFLKDRKKLVFDLLKFAAKLKNGRPSLYGYFVTCGLYSKEPELKAAFELASQKLQSHGLFHHALFEPIDSNEIIKKAAAARAEVVGELPVLGFAPYPIVDGIGEAYVAIAKAKDIVDCLLRSPEGKLRPFVFEENVRDFLGQENPVNAKIANTLSDTCKNKKFGILNNGITIISPDISYRGNTFTLKDFQIVNGCQTSNVLFEEYANLDDSVVLTAKLVEATDPEVVSDIIRATNSQSKVEDSSFLSLQPISRRLEDYFNARQTMANEPKLFLERRQGQFRAHDLIQSRVFTLRDVYRASAALWFNRPDLAGRYPADIIKELPILLEERSREIVYYTGALATYKFGLLIGSRKLPADFSKAKWHLVMGLKYFATNMPAPNINNKSADVFCDHIIKELSDENGVRIFGLAVQAMRNLGDYSRDRIRTKAYIDDLKQEAQRLAAITLAA